MAMLEVNELNYVYGEGTPFVKKAVDNVSFTVEKGSITGIIGHTGSGKSTLVQMLNGIIKPKSGSVILEGEDIYKTKKSLYEARFKIGLVFQYPEYQLFEETVRKDIAFGPSNMGLGREDTAKRVEEAAKLVGLDAELLDRSPFELSGGQKRRAAIAGVMAMMPRVLILDEPASGLDPIGRESVFSALVRYRDETGAAVIIISHSMEDMARYADRVIVLKKGAVIMNGTKDEIFGRAPELISAGLDLPEVTRVVMKIREKGYDISPSIYTVEDAARAVLLLKGGERR